MTVSLDLQEKYVLLPSAVVRAGPPASLLSLPVELVRSILGLLSRDEQVDLSSVCMRLLKIIAPVMRVSHINLKASEAIDYLSKRVSAP